jgi:hypothetical protein
MDLSDIKCTISGDNVIIMDCLYNNISGSCIYEKVVISGKQKPIKQNILILTDFNMEDIIMEIQDKYPMSENLPMLIREYTRGLLVVSNNFKSI